MQKTKEVQAGGKTYIIKELPMRAVWSLVNRPKDDNTPLVDQVKTLLQLSCPELTTDSMLDLYPSEIEELWQAAQEVNAAFLGVLRKAGIFDTLMQTLGPIIKGEMLKALRKIDKTLIKPSVSSSSADTVQ
jgi:hypothetical protein